MLVLGLGLAAFANASNGKSTRRSASWWRRREPARLRRAVAVHPELVRAAARACDRDRVLGRRRRIDHPAAVDADHHRPRRLALGVPRVRADHRGAAVSAQSAAAQTPAGHRPASGRRRGGGAKDLQRPRRAMSSTPRGPRSTGRSRARCARRASGGSGSAISRSSMPGTPCRCTRPSTWSRSASRRSRPRGRSVLSVSRACPARSCSAICRIASGANGSGRSAASAS